MPESKKSTSPKQIIDVTHADKTAPSDTSRPVIVTNRPILKDPMMSPATAPAEKDEPAPSKESLATPSKSKIKPIEEPAADSTKDSAKSEEPKKPELETAPEPTAEPASKPEPAKPDEPEEPEESNAPSKTPDADADIAASKQAEHDAAMQKLVEAKQYFLPINAVEKRRSKRFVATGVILSVILLAFWADVALDAGLVHLGGIKAVTHFFSN